MEKEKVIKLLIYRTESRAFELPRSLDRPPLKFLNSDAFPVGSVVIAGKRDTELVRISSSCSDYSCYIIYCTYCQPFAALDDFDGL